MSHEQTPTNCFCVLPEKSTMIFVKDKMFMYFIVSSTLARPMALKKTCFELYQKFISSNDQIDVFRHVY